MKFAVRFYTKTGNTKRLAEAIANELGVEALPLTSPITEPVDILFLGNSYYAFSIDPEVRSFVASLSKLFRMIFETNRTLTVIEIALRTRVIAMIIRTTLCLSENFINPILKLFFFILNCFIIF